MKVEPINLSRLTLGDTVYEGNFEIEKPTKAELRLLAGAEAAGDVRLHASKDERRQLDAHVESDADSLKAQAKAMRDGSWQRSNAETHLHQAQRMLDSPARYGLDTDAQKLASVEVRRDTAAYILKAMDEGASYDDAADAFNAAQAGVEDGFNRFDDRTYPTGKDG